MRNRVRWLVHGVSWRLAKCFRIAATKLAPPKAAASASHVDRLEKSDGSAVRGTYKERYVRNSSGNIYDAIDYLRNSAVQEQHRILVERTRQRVAAGEPLRAAIIVNERAKWNMDSLVAELIARHWEVTLYLLPADFPWRSDEEKAEHYLSEAASFSELGIRMLQLYNPETDLTYPLEEIDADIAFFQQPWGMMDGPRRLTRICLPVYIHYGFALMSNHDMHNNIGTFHSYIWRYFEPTSIHAQTRVRSSPDMESRVRVVGYPKLDVYLSPSTAQHSSSWPNTDESRERIIFAPHHSLGKKSLRMSTFRWSAQALLELARSSPDIDWVYRPHPKLHFSVSKSGVMTPEEYATYVDAWRDLPNARVSQGGPYLGLFRSATGLITDSGSFLAEFLPSGSPIFWLRSNDAVPFNPVGRKLSMGFYEVGDSHELVDAFECVVRQGNDFLRGTRVDLTQLLFPQGEAKSAIAVVDALMTDFTSSWQTASEMP